MAKADALAVKSGVPNGVTSIELMENAGLAVVKTILKHYAPCKVLIICGPGNNGGDGFVVARLLKQHGWLVDVALFGDKARLKGDAKINADKFDGEIKSLNSMNIKNADLIVDALFGAGLDRDLTGEVLEIVANINQCGVPVVAIDVPTGIDGETGQVKGAAIKANHTVSFFRAKPAHYLLPGREYCGELHIADIGIPDRVLQEIDANTWLNRPNLWTLPQKKLSAHKYDAGHCIIVSGDELHTGAARLAARAALRIGAGLVSLVGSKAALLIHAAHLSSIMLKPLSNANDLSLLLADKRFNSLVIGPALGVGQNTRDLVLAALASSANIVIDADGLTSFSNNPKQLFEAIKARKSGQVVLTPHGGEFAKIFNIKANSKVDVALKSAKISGAAIILKGADTVIATPDGLAIINDNAPPYLATAGSGDVLAGIIGGLLAQGMSGFKAAAAGVYLHGAAGGAFGGQGLIADDLPDILPQVMNELGFRAY